MEKRMLLAFLLSFIVLVGWSLLFSPEKKQKPVIDKPLSEERSPEPVKETGPAPLPLKEKIETLTSPQVLGKEIIVESPLYRAVFSNIGANLKSFQLKKYFQTPDKNSPRIELVSLPQGQKPFLDFYFQTGTVTHHPGQTYTVNRDRINLYEDSRPQELNFQAITPDGLVLNQIYRFYPDRYDMDLNYSISNPTSTPVEGKPTAVLRNLPPQDKRSYYAFIGLAILLGEKFEEFKPKKLKETKILTGPIHWMAYENEYFMAAIIPEGTGSEGEFRGKDDSGVLEASFISPKSILGPSEKIAYQYKIYLGPRDIDILEDLDKGLERAVNYGIFNVIAKPLLWLLRFFNKYLHNYGLSIILLTIIIKILFWPLTHKSYKSMKEMQKIQPLMAKLRERYKNNKEQMSKELMGLYRTYKVNPMSGCLPMLIQMPVLFAMFRILGNSIELRHAPFILWMNDLSAPDRLFHFPFEIPFMENPDGIPVLTLLMGASMLLQQRMTPMTGDPTQQKMMMLMPIIFTVMFINFPSGLVLYWLVQNIISIGQQYRILKKAA